MNQKIRTLKNIGVLFSSLRYFYERLPQKGESPQEESYHDQLEKLKHYRGSGTYCYYAADLRKLRIVHVGGSFQKMTGIAPEKMLNRNFAFGLRFFFLEQIPDIMRCMIEYHKYVYNKPLKDRMRIKGSLILKVKDGKGGYFIGLLMAAPLALDSFGHVAVMFTSVTNVDHLSLTEEMLKIDIIDESDDEDVKLVNIIEKKDSVVLNLSRSELRVLDQLKQGKGTKEIADLLSLSEHTVNNHRRNMLKKTNVKNTAELISKARPVL